MRQLRERGQTLPGIAVTGYGQQADVERSSEAGFAAHLTKPVDFEQLRLAIAKACGLTND
jgi:CheY-like chemotaxis protein